MTLVPRRTALVLALLVALAVAGCGSKKSSSSSASGVSAPTSTISHTKTKFVLHAGLAFGAFHRWIYKPAKAGDFSHPLSHKVVVVKAGAAGLFVYHELKLAVADAKADPALSKLIAPLTALDAKMHGLAAGIKGGHPDTAAITQSNGAISAIKAQSAQAGQPVTEAVPSSL
jgi:hypothetical protein